MQLVEQPLDHMPCYNSDGEYVFQETINNAMPSYPMMSIGPANNFFQQNYQLSANDIVLNPLNTQWQTGAYLPWPGGYVTVSGTNSYDGTYLVKREILGQIFVLQGDASFPQEFGGTWKTHLNNMELVFRLGIEDVAPLTLRTPASADGMFRVSVHDYIKDYFFYLLSFPQSSGFFTQFCTTIRYGVTRFGSEFDQVTRSWDGKKWIYTKQRKIVFTGNIAPKVVVNAALNYYDARLAGVGLSLSGDLVSPSGNDRARFLTYRPRKTYITQSENTLLTHLRDSTGTYSMIITTYDGNNSPVQTIVLNEFDTEYQQPHHITWNVGTLPLGLSSMIKRYECYVNVNGQRRSETFTFHIKNECRRIKLYFKNEFGAIDDFTFTGYTDSNVAATFRTAGTPNIVNRLNPGNYFKTETDSPTVLVLNSGIIDTAHATWLQQLGRGTECFVELIDTDLEDIPVLNRLIPVIVSQQQVSEVVGAKNTHNVTIEVEIPFTVTQIGNRTK